MSLRMEAERILERFREDAETAEKNRKPLGGFLGFGKTPADDPCHEILYRSVEELVGEALNETDDAEETDAVVNTILRAEKSLQVPLHAHYSLIAVQRHMIQLIPRMTEEGKGELLEWYEKQYPVKERFPIQDEILTALGGERKKSRKSLFRKGTKT